MSRLSDHLRRLVSEAVVQRPGDPDERSLVVFGPPGTGKTTAMRRMVLDDLMGEGVDPERMMVATFTRNARREILQRLHKETGLGERDWPWVRTIHSACFHLLELSQEQMVGDNHLQEFGEAYGYAFSGEEQEDGAEGYPGLPATRSYGEWALFAEQLRRACQLTVPEAVRAFGHRRTLAATHWSESTARRFADQYRDFKRQQRLFDFTDLLEITVEQGLSPPLTHVYIDEAQDLSHLQWTVVDQWARQARAVVAFGDDDQAIYSFAGADPEALLRRAGARAVLSQSWRLPANIHRTAEGLISRVRARAPKVFRPDGEGGRVGRLYSWADLYPQGDERWLVLARNRVHLAGVRHHLRQRLVPFFDRTSGSGIPDPESPTGRAIATAFELQRGRLVVDRRAIRNLRSRV
ncbi:MAG: UvrD-helicase domain-containing protein, partial [Candidatus Dormibacteraceae bacterium]